MMHYLKLSLFVTENIENVGPLWYVVTPRLNYHTGKDVPRVQ